MIRSTLLLALLFLYAVPTMGQFMKLSAAAEIQVLTVDPGAELYSAFGHSAFRVLDRRHELDRIYNYGSFDFNTEGFYLKFAQGKLPYFLSIAGPQRFADGYLEEGRSVRMQILNLEKEDAQAVFNFLENNRKPENKFYAYDFFFDNCATRERDVLNEVLGDRIDWNPWPADSLGTLRELLDLYLVEREWQDFGIDIALGLPTDAQATQDLSMFLPDYLFLALEGARIKTASGTRPLVTTSQYWVKPNEALVVEQGIMTPRLVFWSLFTLTLLLSLFVKASNPLMRVFDALLFLSVGLLGIVMVLFWVGTDHQATFSNMNLLWAVPFHAVFAFLRFGGNRRQRRYAGWSIAWYALAMIIYLFVAQPFNAAIWPLIFTLGIRLLSVVGGSLDD